MDTIKADRITFDPAKSEINARERGLPFSLVRDEFDWTGAQIGEDLREDYGERRYEALGYVGSRLHVVVFTTVEGIVRVISFRKANKRESRRYEQATQARPD